MSIDHRFWSKVRRAEGCWEWEAGKTGLGYGKFWLDGRTVLAHRVAYELTNGAIPDGLHIDHLCRVRHCVRPDHLEPVTHWVNNIRGVGISAQNARKTHCPQGHPYSRENTHINSGGRRVCRECNAERCRQYKQRRAMRAAGVAA